jgi:glycogen debranching enzyme
MSISSSAERSTEPGDPLVIDGISYIPSSVLLTGIPKLTFKDNRSFGVLDPRGESPRSYSSGSELGVYFNDTRYLSIWEMTMNGGSPVALAHELRHGGNTLVISMTNRDMTALSSRERIPRDTFLIRRILTLQKDALIELVVIRNFDSRDHLLQLEHWAGSRFDDIFEVRGFPRARRGNLLPPEETADGQGTVTTLSYRGLDERIRKLHIQRLFAAEKIRLSPGIAGHFSRVEVPAKGEALLRTVISFDERGDCRLRGRDIRDLAVPEAMALMHEVDESSPLQTHLSIETDNAIVNRAILNARTDIRMLMTEESGNLLYPYAGIPWFSAPFGRDGIITAYQMLPWYPKLARGVLDYAFNCLGSKFDDFTDESPGKVFHEMRRGEMSNTHEVPFIPYYGSVDSTPLALILLHEYIAWTMDLEKLKDWWPSALRALEWVRRTGDPNGDGFLEYARQSATGLVNQGWKDSHDSVMHADGRLARTPISLCEVQGYAFRARIGMSKLARLLGKRELADQLRREALELRALFSEKFWEPVRGFVHLALDGDADPCAVLSSNMGHCLWSRILSPEQASSVTSHLMSEPLFNGYGIRTLADTERAYNPLSYHNGSIWPHDNSLILEGFRMYDQVNAVERLSTGILNVLESSSDFRLPELFCGFRRRGNEPPIPYEVACKPQAWAAGSVYLLLKSMLGIGTDVDQEHLVFRKPVLTSRIGHIEIKNLRGRDWELDLALRRSDDGTSLEVTRRTGKVRVLTLR